MNKKFGILFIFILLVGTVFLSACSQDEAVGGKFRDKDFRSSEENKEKVFAGVPVGALCTCSGEGICLPKSYENKEENGGGGISVECESSSNWPCDGSCSKGNTYEVPPDIKGGI